MTVARKGEKKDWNPKEFGGEELKKDPHKEIVKPNDERKARDPMEFSGEELRRDAEKEMVLPEQMKKSRKIK